ncbi:hypothetical protein [Actinosynnema sp.]|uniref:hypothetical protein n=1 Tax=Actinosynnema sp. TaxID=1872144 RepID=UPI003F82C262
MVTTVAHAYPWDLVGDPAAAERIAALGVDAVALAASYHTVRAATPFHPRHRLVDARHAAFYLPVRPRAWGRLVPAAPTWVDGENPYGAASDALRAVGLPVHAWTVLTHSSRLGDLHPDLVVRNAFGDRYPYALCPANPDVAEYAAALVTEVLDQGAPDGVVLEACGPLGFTHGGHHEKTDGADWGPVAQKLLSLCFCAACERRYPDADAVRAAVRAGVDGGAPGVEEALGEWAAGVRAARTALSRDLRRDLVGLVRAAGAKAVVHATADPWGTGPFATVADGVGVDVDVLTLTCWGGPEASLPAIEALREAAPGVPIAAYVLALPPRTADAAALVEEWRHYGVDELHLYHAGLASADRMSAMGEALGTLRGQPVLHPRV